MTLVSVGREFDRVDNTLRTYTYERYNNGYISSGWDNRGVQNTWYLQKFSKVWIRTPGYLAKRKAGTLPNNPYNFEKLSYEVTPYRSERSGTGTGHGSWDVQSYTYISEYSHTRPSGVSVSEFLDTTYPVLQAKLDALNKAKRNQFNLPVFLIEGKKTTSMVTKRALQMARAMYSLRKGDFRGFRRDLHESFYQSERKWSRSESNFNKAFGKRTSKAVSDTWLEYQYGWIPFMLEVRSGVNTLMDVLDKPDNRIITVIGRGGDSRTRALIGTELMVSPRVFGDFTHTAKLSTKCTWSFTPNQADLPGKFLLTNPAEVIWEVVPLSFVVDWFLPIGDYLSTLDASIRFTHYAASIGLLETQKSATVYNRDEYGAKITGTCRGQFMRVSRSPLNSSPVPGFQDFLFANNKLSAARAVSAIALLRQQFR